MEYQAHALAVARLTLASALEAAVGIQANIDALQQRLHGARARYTDSLAAMRTGTLDETLAAARMAAATADAADLEVMITEVRPSLEIAERAQQKAAPDVQAAERAVALEELRRTAVALDDQIRHIEGKLCEALAARYQIFNEMNGARGGSLFRVWQPTDALRRAVVDRLPPGQ